MRILIDAGHPAHVHLFRNLAGALIKKGHRVLFTVREKEKEAALLNHYDLPHVIIGRHRKSLAGKITGLISTDLSLVRTALGFRPDLFISHGSFYAAHAAFLTGKQHLALEDTGNLEQIRLYKPFTSLILTPDSLRADFGEKQIRYPGFHELAYLQPNYFKPNPGISGELGLHHGEKYALVRFVSWKATHDTGEKGLDLNEKTRLIQNLSEKMRVFVTSEVELPEQFGKYSLPVPFHKIHDVMAFAQIYIGEGATMASECAILGTPAIFTSTIHAGTIDEQERYGLVFHCMNFEQCIERVNEITGMEDSRLLFSVKRDAFLRGKTDLTALLLWLTENFPASLEEIREHPGLVEKFKNN